MEKIEKQGDIAEGFVKGLLNKSGITVNPSQDDDQGWDWFCEFPLRYNENTPLDKTSPPLKVKIQVKSVSKAIKHKYSVQFKLSNLHQYSLDPYPYFLVLVSIDPQTKNVKQLYIKHFWKDEIELTLKKLREHHVEKGNESTHRKKIGIQFNQNDLLDSLTYNDFTNKIESLIPCYTSEYNQKKIEFHKKVGYSDKPDIWQVTFNSSQDELKNAFLGKKQNLDVANINFFQERFGITLPNNEIKLDLKDTTINFDPKGTSCKFIFKSIKRDTQYIFDANIYNLPKEIYDEKIFRFATRYFNIVVNYSNNKDKINLSTTINNFILWDNLKEDYEKKYDIFFLRDLFSILHMVYSKEELILELKLENKHSVPIGVLHQNKTPSKEKHYLSYLTTIIQIEDILKYFNFNNLSHLQISMSDIEYMKNTLTLSPLFAIISHNADGNYDNIKIDFPDNNKNQIDEILKLFPKNMLLMQIYNHNIGNLCIFYIVVFFIKDMFIEETDSSLQLTISKVEIKEKEIDFQAFAEDYLKNKIANLEQYFESKGYQLFHKVFSSNS